MLWSLISAFIEETKMRRRSFILAAAATGLTSSAHAATPPIVLELFTSQGCSSCPPADALLGELVRRPGVVALAWHVDYWDNLGWRDPYASKLATERQRSYAARLHDEVYTPALVVNGAAIVVGSDRNAVASAMADAHALTVAATLRRGEDGIEARLGETEGPLSALLAVYDPQRATAVEAGENEGQRLREHHIVRATHHATAGAGAAQTLHFPAIASGQGAVLLLQDDNLRVLGAADLGPVAPS
jgi:hypothetical protein